jgi:hypothetical protein
MMKDLHFGVTRVGLFRFSLQPPVFDERPADEVSFFEVMVSEPRSAKPDSDAFYTHLVEDPRFALFSSFGKFDRPLRTEEVIEYNTYLLRMKLLQPTWKLSRHTVSELMDVAAKAKRKP